MKRLTLPILFFSLLLIARSVIAVNLPIGTLPRLPAPSASPSDSVLTWNTTTQAGNQTLLYDLINLPPFQTKFNYLDPMTTAGDLIYNNSSPAPARLGIGSTGQILTVSGGYPVWQNAPTGLPSPGPSGDVLTANGTSWVASPIPQISPAGSSGAVQYNNSGTFGGFGSWNGTTLGITGVQTITNNTPADTVLKVTAAASQTGDLQDWDTATNTIAIDIDKNGNLNFNNLTSSLPMYLNGSGNVTTQVIPPSGGGTGASSTPTNGQIPIGNGTNYTPAALTAGSGISVTNGSGSVSIAETYPMPSPSPSSFACGQGGAWAPCPAPSSGSTLNAYNLASPSPSPIASLAAPNFQMTALGNSSALIETGNNNFLINPSMQGPVSGGNALGWSGGLASTSTAVTFGRDPQSILITAASVSGNLFYQDVPVTAGSVQNLSLEHTIKIFNPSSSSFPTSVTVCPRQNGATVGQCTNVPAGGTGWQDVTAYSVGGSGTTSVGVSIYSSSSIIANAYVARAYVGQNRNIGTVAQAQFLGTVKLTGCSTVGNTTSGSFTNFSNTAGCTFTPTGSVQSPGSQLAGFSISNLAPGTISIVATGGFYGTVSSTTASALFRFSDGTNSSAPNYIYSGIGGSSSNTIQFGSIAGQISYTSPQSNLTIQIQGAVTTGSTTAGISPGTSPIQLEFDVYYFPSQSQAVQSAQNIINRTGEIFSVMGSCPAGSVATNGTSIGLSSGTYQGSAFYNLYAQLWGAAGLTTTAGQPLVISSAAGSSASADWAAGKTITINMQGLFLRNLGGSSPNIAGVLGALQTDQMQGHLHGGNTSNIGVITGSAPYFGEGAGQTNTTGSPVSDSVNGTPRTGLETRPANTAVNFCINPQYTQPAAVIVGYLNGPTSSTSGDIATFNVSTGTSLGDSGVGISTSNIASSVVERDSNGNYQSNGVPSTQIVSITSASSPYTVASGVSVILVNTSSGAITINLPNPNTYRTLQIKDIGGALATNNVTLAQYASEQIEGVAASLVLSANGGNYKFQSDGTNWWKISTANNLASKTFTSSGTWVAPAGVYSVNLYGRGGAGGGSGGGGGGGGSTAAGAAGGGGGAGGYGVISSWLTVPITLGQSVTVTIGAGGAAGSGGAGAVANAAGAAGTNGTAGGAGGNTTFGSLATFQGSTNVNAVGNAGSLATAGGTSNPSSAAARSVTATAGGAGGTANTAGTATTSPSTPSPGGARISAGTAGAAGGTGGGGGGGNGGSIGSADAPATGTAANGGAGGASGSAGSAGGNAPATQQTNGNGGLGGGGGGGGGLLASTGTAGGAGGNGQAGSNGQLIVYWQE